MGFFLLCAMAGAQIVIDESIEPDYLLIDLNEKWYFMYLYQ